MRGVRGVEFKMSADSPSADPTRSFGDVSCITNC
jgi:hypothetical protein